MIKFHKDNERLIKLASTIPFGAVCFSKGKFKGRIGYFDDTEFDDNGVLRAVVYFGHILYGNSVFIDLDIIRQANIQDLVSRSNEIDYTMFCHHNARKGSNTRLSNKRIIELLSESKYINSEMFGRFINDRLTENLDGTLVFISHSSKDKQKAIYIASDLRKLGYDAWLDTWRIRAGDSIMNSISGGLTDSKAMLVLLSKNSVNSSWVEHEWQSKYWDEIKSKKIMVIPVLLEDCEVPILLRPKKYADFTSSYSDGLEEIKLTLRKLADDVTCA